MDNGKSIEITNAIIRAITDGGGNRYGQIFSRAGKYKMMSKMTFDSHLKELVAEKYVSRKEIGNKHVVYSLDGTVNRLTVEQIFLDKVKEINNRLKLIADKSNLKSLKGNQEAINMFVKSFDRQIQIMFELNNHIDFYVHTKHISEIMKKNMLTRQTKNNENIENILKIMEKIDPAIRENFENYMIVKFSRVN